MTLTIYCAGETEAARHGRVDIDTLQEPFGQIMPGSNQTLAGDRPVRLGGVSFTGDDRAVLDAGSPLSDVMRGKITTRTRTRYECPECALNVTVTGETWERRVRQKADVLVSHGASDLALVALARIVHG